MSATFEYGVCRLRDLQVPESVEPADAQTGAWWRAYPPMTTECPK